MSGVAGSSIGGGFISQGSQIYPSPAGTVFTEIQLESQVQADALVDPSDTPTVDTSRMVRDAAGNLVLYHYSVTQAAWKGVQLG